MTPGKSRLRVVGWLIGMQVRILPDSLCKNTIMKTSYFSSYKGNNGVSIALFPPKGYNGRECKLLAPSRELLDWWRFTGKTGREKEEGYKRGYWELIKYLDPKAIFESLDKDAVLLCYEKPGDFCHRRLVAKWLETKIGIKIPEIHKEKKAVSQLKLF